MRLTTQNTKDVVITAVMDDLDIAIQANGVNVCWIRRDGTLLLNNCDSRQLSGMGFRMRGKRVELDAL